MKKPKSGKMNMLMKPGMKKAGGKKAPAGMPKFAKGGGIESKGKTKGKMIKM